MGKLAPFLILAAGGVGVWFLFRFLFPKPPPVCANGESILPSGGCGHWEGGHGVAADPSAPPRVCDKRDLTGWQCSNDVAPLVPPPAGWPANTWYTIPKSTGVLSTGEMQFWGAAPVTPTATTIPTHPPGVPTPPAAALPPRPPGERILRTPTIACDDACQNS
jgi:hypothetical protein